MFYKIYTTLNNPMLYFILTIISECFGYLRYIMPNQYGMFCCMKVTIDVVREYQKVILIYR